MLGWSGWSRQRHEETRSMRPKTSLHEGDDRNLLLGKTSLVNELFVRSADDNYITARWCAQNELNIDFLWLSSHAIEKYLKATLLLNGHSSITSATNGKKYSHNIELLYQNVKRFAEDLLPDKLSKPSELDIFHWRERTPEEYLKHLTQNGNADNRYLIYGYDTVSEDVHMLDAMVFAIRRLICPLDERWFPHDQDGAPKFTHREHLLHKNKYYQKLAMPLDEIIRETKSSPKRDAALNLNMMFAPENFQHKLIRAGSAWQASILDRRVLDPLESDDSRTASQGIKIAQWLVENVKLPQDSVKGKIEESIRKAKNKHCLG